MKTEDNKNTESTLHVGMNASTEGTEGNGRVKHMPKRIAALVAVILWGMLLIATLLAAILDRSDNRTVFKLCAITSIALPVFAWICIWCVGKLTGRHTIADLDIGGTGDY